MAHAQKSDFVFPRNGRLHLNRWGRQFSRLLAAEVCASALVMLDTPCSDVAWEYWLPTPFASFPFTSPPVRHRVPSGSERALPTARNTANKHRTCHEHTTWTMVGVHTALDGTLSQFLWERSSGVSVLYTLLWTDILCAEFGNLLGPKLWTAMGICELCKSTNTGLSAYLSLTSIH